MKFDRTEYINSPSVIENELKKLFDRSGIIIIFDIGACEGEDSIKYARLFPKAIINAFEPLPKNLERISANFLMYGVSNAKLWHMALSDREGTSNFYVSDGKPKDIEESDWDFGNKSSSLLEPDKHMEKVDFISFDEQIRVETTTLKSFCRNNNIHEIDFIHMDVQGAELLVLKGAGDMIYNIKAIWLEVSTVTLYKEQPLVKDVERFMNSHGFYLAKTCVNEVAGDQFYLSKKYFTNYKEIFSEKTTRHNIIFNIKNLIRKLLASKLRVG